MSYAIKTEELSKRFGRVQALNGLNLKVPEGAIYALVGPNGAGKTTTLKLLMNVLRPTSGNCEVLGVASEKLRYCDLAVIGYESENQDMPDWMTGRYLLSYLRPFYPTWDDGVAYETARLGPAARSENQNSIARRAHEASGRVFAHLSTEAYRAGRTICRSRFGCA